MKPIPPALLLLLAAAGAAQAAPAPGGTLFADNCAACHQPTGKGVPPVFPALAGNAFVTGPAPQVMQVLLNGRGGMPSFANELDNDKLASVVSYIRSSWGNEASAVSPAEAAAARNGPRIAEDPGKALQAH